MSLRSVRRLLASTGMVGAAVLVLAASALPVQAADFIPIEVFGAITNFNGQCLEDPNGSTQPGVQAVVNPCNGLPRQQWALVLFDTSDLRMIQNGRSGLCLSILNDFTGVGGRVVQESCNSSDRFQHWKMIDQTTIGFEFANNGDGGLVMHPALCTSATGAEIYMNVSGQCRVDFWH